MMTRVCVFCGSSPGHRPTYLEAARQLGTLMAARGTSLVYGGASIGLMGAIADACLAGGGHVTGVIPQNLVDREIAHDRLSDLRIVGSMHERKALMADLADAFVVLPGGMGTLEEACEVLTWGQLGLHAKPCGFLNVAGYFDQLIGFLDHAVTERFLKPEYRSMIIVEQEPIGLLGRLDHYRARPLPRVLDRGAT